MKNFITQAASQFGAIWSKIGVNQKISIVLVGVLTIGGLWAFVSIAKRPNYEVLFSNVSPSDGAAITAHLSESGIPYKLKGDSVYVPSNMKSQVRMELAAKGLPQSQDVSLTSYIKPGAFGKTDQEMELIRLGALQSDLAKSIQSISSVRSAKLHIVIPNDSLFSDEQQKTTASVLLSLEPGAVLHGQQVNAIRYLVSMAVKGLDVKNITIVDTDGNILSKGGGDDSVAGLTDEQLSYKKSVESDLAMKAQGILDRVVGPGKSIVTVVAQIDFDEKTSIQKMPTTGTPVSETTTTTTGKDTTSKASGEPGAASNTGGRVVGAGDSSRSSEEKTEVVDTRYEVGSSMTEHHQKPGTIKRLSVAASVAKPAEGEQRSVLIADLEEMVKTAVGYDASRNDVVTVKEVEFVEADDTAVVESGSALSGVMGQVLKNLPLAGVIIVLLLFFRHLLKKTKLPEREVPEELRRPQMRQALAAGTPQGEMSVEEAEELLELPESETPAMEKIIWRLADERPENLARMLRSWLKD